MRRLILLIALIVSAPTSLSANDAVRPLAPIAEMTLQHQPNASETTPQREPVFGTYLGSGDGTATGVFSGRIGWDLYEDQTSGDAHPTFYRGVIEKDGASHAFGIIGVLTPEPSRAPEEIQRWSLSGTIVFETNALIGARQAPITGEGVLRAPGGWRHRLTIWARP